MPLRRILQQDMGLKVFSVMLATLIWLTVHGVPLRGPTTRVFRQHMIAVLQQPSVSRAYKVSPTMADITVSGDPDMLTSLSAEDIEAFVNLTNLLEARSINKRVQVSAPAGITVTAITPPVVMVEVRADDQNPRN